MFGRRNELFLGKIKQQACVSHFDFPQDIGGVYLSECRNISEQNKRPHSVLLLDIKLSNISTCLRLQYINLSVVLTWHQFNSRRFRGTLFLMKTINLDTSFCFKYEYVEQIILFNNDDRPQTIFLIEFNVVLTS